MSKIKLENYLNQSLDQVMSDCFGQYSKYIIQDRALPDVRDGLKPVQRRILFSMVELGLFHNKTFKKSARVVGDVIGKYHPHGDSSIYEALVRMSQNWKINIPLIEMHGNNGSVDDDPPAAMRYTEARLSKISYHLFDNIKKETVLFAPNFDDSEKEPTVFPALFPNLLVNGAKGIAAGYATEMPSHNLGEVINVIIAKIKRPHIQLQQLLKYINGPDFPTGAVVHGKQGIFDAFKTGKGRILICSKYQILNIKNKSFIVINEIPYGVIKSKLVRQIDEIRFNNKITGIKEVRDESDRNGILIKIELESQNNTQAILNYLLAKTEMQIYYNYNNVAIREKIPVQMGLIELIDSYLKHQKKIQLQTLKFDLNQDKRRLEIIKGLIKVARNINDVVKIIQSATGSKKGVIIALMKSFDFTQLQAEAIAELRLYRLSQSDQSTYYEEEQLLLSKIEKNEIILNSDDKFNDYLISLLIKLKKEYAVSRKTIIKDSIQQVTVDMEALIKHEQIWIGISKDGYIKRFSNQIYKNNKLEDYTIRLGDALIYIQFINTQYKLLIFTNNGNYIFLSVHKIIETKFKDVGKHINDFVLLDENEYIIDVIAVKDFETNCYISLATSDGKGKRVKINDFKVSQHTKSYKAIKLASNANLVAITISNGFKQLIYITKKGFANRFYETQLPIQSLKSSGVKTINLINDKVVALTSATNNDILGMVSQRGGIKRFKIDLIPLTNRALKGKMIFRVIKNNPHLVLSVKVVVPQNKIIFSKNKLNIYKFNEVLITSEQEGFSLLGNFNNGALIDNFIIIDKDNDYFKETINTVNDEDRFKQSEALIDSTKQISIEELLKDTDK